MKTDIVRQREEALQAFRESRIGKYGVNPERVFLEGWDARQAVEDAIAPKLYAVPELRSSGWVAGPIV